ncbi:MAG: type II toxin-antitoxin system HicB family antitoxin [Anaerolineae bacterium]|nr:type II toxin-antitoxin system HicB family antitoxin [Anaerolineae bacterium]
MTQKTIDDYLSLPYTIEVIPDDDGFVARVKELSGCMTQADTWDEIWPMIEDAKRLWLESALAHGDAVPELLGVFG